MPPESTNGAVARAIYLIRKLEQSGPATLKVLGRDARIPRASLLRILATLEKNGVVSREKGGWEYHLIEKLAPAAGAEWALEQRMQRALDHLARETTQTAEWWRVSENGLVLAQQAQPPEALVQVRAGIGFTRSWGSELDAAMALALKHGVAPGDIAWHGYVADGRLGELNSLTVSQAVNSIHASGFSRDLYWNSNGVRRFAMPVLRVREEQAPELWGVLAVAQTQAPYADERIPEIRMALLTARLQFDHAAQPDATASVEQG